VNKTFQNTPKFGEKAKWKKPGGPGISVRKRAYRAVKSEHRGDSTTMKGSGKRKWERGSINLKKQREQSGIPESAKIPEEKKDLNGKTP